MRTWKAALLHSLYEVEVLYSQILGLGCLIDKGYDPISQLVS